MRKQMKSLLALALAGIMTMSCTACGLNGESDSPLSASNPTAITIWNYYNGDQLTAFDELVSEFNSTVGVEKGIAVTSVGQGSIDNLADALMDSVNGKVGAQDLPTLASIYAETAFILDNSDQLVHLDSYFTEDELAQYIPSFIEEGRMTENGDLLLFPVSKSTECFAANKTDWADFEKATGISIDSIDTYEKLTAAAKSYYEWTDSLTPDVPEDGKALYGRDSVANYIFIGTEQLGHEMFKVDKNGVTVDMDTDTFRTLWDNYYVPFINGYFISNSPHRSEDMKTGDLLALTGSTSGVSYLPTEVTNEDDVTHEIQIEVKKPFGFENGDTVAVQQGAGYCVLKGTEAQQYAAVEFLKWFTEANRNLDFSLASGYSSVTVDGNKEDAIRKNFQTTGDSAKEQNILNALLVSADIYSNERTYTCKPFNGSKAIRDILADALTNAAVNDRAAVVAAIEEGKTREEATAPFLTDEYFTNWFQALCSEIDDAVSK